MLCKEQIILDTMRIMQTTLWWLHLKHYELVYECVLQTHIIPELVREGIINAVIELMGVHVYTFFSKPNAGSHRDVSAHHEESALFFPDPSESPTLGGPCSMQLIIFSWNCDINPLGFSSFFRSSDQSHKEIVASARDRWILKVKFQFVENR